MRNVNKSVLFSKLSHLQSYRWLKKAIPVFLGSTILAASAMASDSVDVAAAKKEGKVIWYTSTPIKQAQQIANLFETQTGIKVNCFVRVVQPS